MLYRKQGKTQDAYRTYEELIFQGHNMLEIAMQNIQLWAIEDGNMEKARFMTEKLKNMEFKPLSPEFAAHLPAEQKGVQVISPGLLFSSDSYTSTPGTGRRLPKQGE